MVRELLINGLMLSGAVFMLLAGLGVVRMPDLYTRMSATSKAATLGSGLVMLAAALHFGEFSITVRVLAIIVFLLLTVPIAAHMIGRAAYFDGVPLWEGTVLDELRGHYSLVDHRLESKTLPASESMVPQGEEGDDFTV